MSSEALLIIAFLIFYQKCTRFVVSTVYCKTCWLQMGEFLVRSLWIKKPSPFNNYSLHADYFHLLCCLCEIQLTGCELHVQTCLSLIPLTLDACLRNTRQKRASISATLSGLVLFFPESLLGGGARAHFPNSGNVTLPW